MLGSPIIFLTLLTTVAIAQNSTTSDIPASLKPAASERMVLQAHATGVQIYACAAGADGSFGWTLKGPRAELRDASGKMIITHSAGPKWQHNDGSSVTGKVRAKENSPDAGSIPWLLLEADNSQSSPGALNYVNFIQRVHTDGGQPPASGCDAAHKGDETQSNYSADYFFYAPVR